MSPRGAQRPEEPPAEGGDPSVGTMVLGVAALVIVVILVFFALGYVLGRTVL